MLMGVQSEREHVQGGETDHCEPEAPLAAA